MDIKIEKAENGVLYERSKGFGVERFVFEIGESDTGAVEEFLEHLIFDLGLSSNMGVKVRNIKEDPTSEDLEIERS